MFWSTSSRSLDSFFITSESFVKSFSRLNNLIYISVLWWQYRSEIKNSRFCNIGSVTFLIFPSFIISFLISIILSSIALVSLLSPSFLVYISASIALVNFWSRIYISFCLSSNTDSLFNFSSSAYFWSLVIESFNY